MNPGILPVLFSPLPGPGALDMSASAAATGSREANCPWKTVDFSPEGDDPAMSDEANYQTLVPAHLLTGVDSDECQTLVPLPVALEFSLSAALAST